MIFRKRSVALKQNHSFHRLRLSVWVTLLLAVLLALIAGIALAWSGRSLFTVAVASCVVVFITEMIVL